MKIQKRQEIEFFGTKTGNANSIALGYATETKNFGEVAVGVMNKSTAAKDPNSPKGVCVDSDATLFSVGCGGSGERKNALEVKGDGSVLISGEDGDINVADKIKQALDTDASIELVKSAESDLQYTLMVNNESRGSINIPKDQFLKNVTYDTEAKQLVFTFVTLDEEEHVERISINDLKDVYTAGDGINIDNNVISADFSSVMTAISDEKTQRETTDNEIKSTLDTKADSNNAVTYNSTNISGLFDNDGNKQESYGYRCIYIGCNNTTNYNNDCIHIGNDNNQLERGGDTICVGKANTFNYGSVCIGDHINSRYCNSIYIGSRITTKEDTFGSYNTIIGSYNGSGIAHTPLGFISVGFQPRADKDGKVLYQIAAHHATDYNKDNYNLEETLTSDHDHKKYIYGVGNYDGTDPITTKAKSLQEVLDDKADITDIDSRLDDLQNYCFKLGDSGEVAAPYKNHILESAILQLNDNDEYAYADLTGGDLIPGETQYIYDKNLNKSIKITELGEEIDINPSGDFFRTTKPLDLTHTFYLDNEKTGVVENLTQLTIKESNFFVNLPYVEVDDNLEDDEIPQYIYDATDNKWIEVVETCYTNSYNGFNTEELLDLTHKLYYSSYPNVLGNWDVPGYYSTSIGYNASASGNDSTAIGANTVASGDNSIAIGADTKSYSSFSTSVGYNASASGNDSIAIGHDTKVNTDNGIAIGSRITIDKTSTDSIAIGKSISSGASEYIALGHNISPNTLCVTIGNNIKSSAGYFSTAIGNNIIVRGDCPVAIGCGATANFESSLALGASSTTGGNYAIALGKNVSNTKSIFGVGFDGVNGIDMDRDNYGLYLKGFGNYDGTNLVVKNGDAETLNPDIKSVQQAINEKVDASAIPAKLSDLENDAVNITINKGESSKRPLKITCKNGDNFGSILKYALHDENSRIGQLIFTSYDENGGHLSQINVRPSDNDEQYVIQVQDIIGRKINRLSTMSVNGFYSTNSKNKTHVQLDTDELSFYTNTDVPTTSAEKLQLTVNKDGITKKDGKATEVFAANGTLFDLSTKADLVDDKLKAEQLPKLDNIAAATTTEDMITKFNALLTDLKAKGYMTADITA